MFLCQYCSREIPNKGGLAAHEPFCKSNPSRTQRQKSPNAHAKKGAVPWNKGLTASTDARIATVAEHLSNTMKGVHRNFSEDGLKRLSISTRSNMRKRYASGWEPTCGRCKKYSYSSPVAGDIKVDGTWELAVARHLDSIGVIWCRNKKRFPYTKPNGTPSTYQPDFYVETWDTFIEVKGYETELDKAKWAQFPLELQIWRKDAIYKIMDSWPSG